MNKIKYEEFIKFLNSDIDEIDFFGLKSCDNLVSVDEYFKEFNEKVEEFFDSINPFVRSMQEKINNPILYTSVSNDKNLIISDLGEVCRDIYIKKSSNKFICNGYYDNFKEFNYACYLFNKVFGGLISKKDTNFLDKKCHRELLEIDTIREDILGDSYERKNTLSNIFLINCYEVNSVFVNNGSRNVTILRDYAGKGNFYGDVNLNTFDASLENDVNSRMYLNKDDCQKILKKIYVQRN